MKQLVVTADDFGIATEVNEAVEQGWREGALTAASLMIGAPAAAEAIAIARANPGLRVGLHLVLVEGRPISPPEEVPNLVDRSGMFRGDLLRAGAAMFFLPHVRRQLAAEIEAQFGAFAATGLAIDHVNAHWHFHLHPTVAHLVASIGPRFGVIGGRAPVEPRAVLDAIEPGRASDLERLTAPLARALQRGFRAAGLTVPNQVFGLRWSGAMTKARVVSLMERLPEGLTEIYLHPARSGGFAGAAIGYRYADELAAILAPETVSAARRPGLRCGGFVDFSGRVPSILEGEAPGADNVHARPA